jgi:hypothetical protein
MKNNKFLKKGYLNLLLDGSFGSSGKGKFADLLVETEQVDYLVTSNSANASHTVVKGGVEYIFKVLPSGVLNHESLSHVFITSGASFSIDDLFAEIDMVGIPKEKIFISPRAGIIEQIDKDYEAGLCDLNGVYTDLKHAGTIATGTTASGSGSVLAKKTIRNKTLVTAGMVSRISGFIANVDEIILQLNILGKTGLFEIGQGYPLSNNHTKFAPFTTSRNVTVAQALSDAFLPVHMAGNVIVNFRTFPIRIHDKKYVALEDAEFVKEHSDIVGIVHHPYHKTKNEDGQEIIYIKKGSQLSWDEKDHVMHEVINSYSGDFYDDSKEITWDDVSKECDTKVFECTTLTKLPRRVATFSKDNLIDAIIHNETEHETFVFMNFVNYVDGDLNGYIGEYDHMIASSSKIKSWILENLEKPLYQYQGFRSKVQIGLFGTGAKNTQVVEYR